MDNIQELREIVNPVFNTAKSCIQLDAASGDRDSQRLLELLGFGPFGEQHAKREVPPELLEQVKRLFPVYMVYTESRFQLANRLIEAFPDRVVVDLPCGYTARGIKMSHQGRTYFGCDLPAVIDVIGPAAEKAGIDPNIHYCAVDATNYASLEAPLAETSGKLLITTEGLLMYFTQSELEEVFANIRKLLQKHGGSWVIVDRTYYTHDQAIAAAIVDHDPRMVALYAAITKQAAGSAADVKFNDNIVFQADSDEEVRAFIRKMGFSLHEIPMGEYLPDHLGALDGAPEAEAQVREVFETMHFWELTVSDSGEKFHHEDRDFSVNGELRGDTLHISLGGRLDTLTAPELLNLYQGVDAQSVRGLEIDLRNLDYVSSAGLRVLLIMYKALEDKSRFRLSGANETVREILETTGFDSVFEGKR